MDKKKTKTRGNIIVEEIKVGDTHYEYEMGMGLECKVMTPPKLEDGMWQWRSKNVNTGDWIDYGVADVNSDNYKFNAQFGLKLYDYKAYQVERYT